MFGKRHRVRTEAMRGRPRGRTDMTRAAERRSSSQKKFASRGVKLGYGRSLTPRAPRRLGR
jgi:hypothetical protein